MENSWSSLAARVGTAVYETSLTELATALASGQETSVSLVQACFDRIDALDNNGPMLNAVIERNPDALLIARQMDEERAQGRVRGPLHGIPMLIKDNIDTADQMLTTAGSLALLTSRPTRDATIAERLRAAGSVIIGKTNLSEWANFRSTHSASGWSSRGGQTLNPYSLDRSPGGSSSGSGAAMAASLAAACIGTETDGSIVCPAALNGIVGIKPTVGLTSRAGIIPIAHSQDTPGPLARTVRDAAIVLGALVGEDARDPATASSTGRYHRDYTPFLVDDGLRGARIGVARQKLTGYHPGTDARLEAAIAAMRQAGATIVDPADIPTSEAIAASEDELTVLCYEFKTDLAAYLATREAVDGVSFPRTMAELIAWNQSHATEVMPYFGQELLEMSAARGELTDEAYLSALANNRRLGGQDGIDAALAHHQLDTLIAPSYPPAWRIDPIVGEYVPGGATTAAAIAGYPLISVPMGEVHGLPIGLTFIGTAWSEPVLIRLAHAFEQLGPWRTPPAWHASVFPLR